MNVYTEFQIQSQIFWLNRILLMMKWLMMMITDDEDEKIATQL